MFCFVSFLNYLDSPDDSWWAVEHFIRQIQYGIVLLLIKHTGRNGQQPQHECDSCRFRVIETRSDGCSTPGAVGHLLLLLLLPTRTSSTDGWLQHRFVSLPDLHPTVRTSTSQIWTRSTATDKVLSNSCWIQSNLLWNDVKEINCKPSAETISLLILSRATLCRSLG